MRATSLVLLGLLCIGPVATAPADETGTDALAAAFGGVPIWDVRLSPDGEHLSLIQMHPSGTSLARVADFATGAMTPIVAGTRDSRELRDVLWCGWANDTRLLCGLHVFGDRTANARLMGIDSDGANPKTLGNYELRRLTLDDRPFRARGSTIVPSRVIDLLPDDADRVLVMGWGPGSYLVAHLDVHSGAVTNVTPGPYQILDWIADRHGEPRLYRRYNNADQWYVRDTPSSAWSLLHERAFTDTEDAFVPVGFGEGRNELLVLDDHQGRRALFALDLDNDRSRRLIYAHDRVDVTAVRSLGKYRRFVAAVYIDDRLRFEFLDERMARLHTQLQALFAGKRVDIVDEDWNERYYLILVEGADDPGTFYRFDSKSSALLELFPAYPLLAGRELAPVREVSYPADDGTRIPAYLTLPVGEKDGPLPAVVLPHDGPVDRDYLRFDFLAQYLAANGYAVLQSNYRGSSGYGQDWAGLGGYRDWRRAIGDIADGAEYLAREGIADATRICIAGWGYGGYAALMNVIEHPDLYRCAASIAGITDPRSQRTYMPGRARAFIGVDEEILEAGSPLERVEEINVPTLLLHGQRDGHVLVKQSADLARALQKAGKDSEFVTYEQAEHDFHLEHDRIDLLSRLAAFLGKHLAK